MLAVMLLVLLADAADKHGVALLCNTQVTTSPLFTALVVQVALDEPLTTAVPFTRKSYVGAVPPLVGWAV